MDFSLVAVFVYVFVCPPVLGNCTWPTIFANSSWMESAHNLLNFTADTMTGYIFVATAGDIGTSISNWKCHSTDWYTTNNSLILRSTTTFKPYNVSVYGYMCWKLQKITDKSFRYYLQAREETGVGNGRILMKSDPASSNFSELCSVGQTFLPLDSEYRVLIKSDGIQSAKINCPYTFLAKYSYTSTGTSPSPSEYADCLGDTLDMCSDNTQMTQGGTCSEKLTNSRSNTVWCVDTVPSNGNNYITIYNNDSIAVIDDATTFRFSCLAVSANNTLLSVTFSWCKNGLIPDQLYSDSTRSSVANLILNGSRCPSCPLLSDPVQGIVSVTTNGAVTTAKYTCSSNKTLTGSDTRICQSNGTWSGTPPSCMCSSATNPTNGTVSPSADGLTVSYTCNIGFVLIGSATRTCNITSNNWTSTSPTCNKCQDLTAPLNGTYNVTSTGITSVVTYTCVKGTTLNGTTNRTCQSDQTWSQVAPICTSCQTLSDPLKGSVSTATNGSMTTATYSCDANFSLTGNASLVCQANGTWSGTPPSCTCPPLDNPANGSVSLSVDGFTAYYACNTSFVLIGASSRTCNKTTNKWTGSDPKCNLCEVLTVPSYGSYNITSTGLTSIATYTCVKGATLNGTTNLLTCLNDSTWYPASPTCVTCPQLVNVSGGEVTLISNGVTTTALYNCSDGYHLVGATSQTCTTSGVWNSSAPKCLCNNPPNTTNGNISVVQDVATYSCDLWFTLFGQSVRYCITNGTGWSSENPKCVGCTVLSDPANGNRSATTNGTVTVVTYSCNLGYTLKGARTSTCQPDGIWSLPAPTCNACTNVTAVSFGSSTLKSNGTTTYAEFSCNAGATLKGDAVATCNENGSWSVSLANASCVQCPVLNDPAKGNVTISSNGKVTSAIYSCSVNFTMTGVETLVCQPNGSWSGTPPLCICSTPEILANGSVSVSADGMTASYACDAFFVLIGASNRTCNKTANKWSGTDPVCYKCQDFSVPSNGSYNITTNGTTSLVTYSCMIGSTLIGSATRTCQPNGTWSTQAIPNCVSCLQLSNNSSAKVTINSDGLTTTASYRCPAEYVLEGDTLLTCTAQGSWSAKAPLCVCNTPTNITDGTVAVNDQNTATYTCDLWFSLSGPSVRYCLTNGSGWSDSNPVCVRCSMVSDLANGSSPATTNGTVTIVTYSCNSGYTLNGTQTSVCQADGIWSSPKPTCSQCSAVPTITFGSVTLKTNGTTTYGEYACNVGATLTDYTMITCDRNGLWSMSLTNTTCVKCEVKNDTGLSISMSSDGKTSKATFTCKLGYEFKGTSTMACSKNGSWSDSWPECVAVGETSTTSNDTGLLNAVIALAVLVALLTVAIGVTIGLIRSTRLQIDNWRKQNEAVEDLSKNAYKFPSAIAPADHHRGKNVQNLTLSLSEFENTIKEQSGAPFNKSLQNAPLPISWRELRLNYVREITSSVIFDHDQPAPWNKKRPKETEHINELGDPQTIPSSTDMVSERTRKLAKQRRRKRSKFLKRKSSNPRTNE